MSNRIDYSTHVIEAAGGLLWRNPPGSEEIVIIHRPKYDDWTLPKGKKETGETWIDTAIREVREETMCLARPKSFAGGNVYTVEGSPKIVLYWNMLLEEDLGFFPHDEVDKLLWLPPIEAIPILSYPSERTILIKNNYF